MYTRVTGLGIAIAMVATIVLPPASARAQELACGEFDSQVWAQAVLDDDPLRAAGLDPDGNGIACEELLPGFAPIGWLQSIPPTAEPAEAIAVADGDTIDVVVDGRQESVRLLAIDTPETQDPERPVQCFGDEAALFVADILSYGPALYLESDRTDRDRYGRLLRFAWLDFGDGQVYLLNEMLARNGFGVRSIYPSNEKYLDPIGDAQIAAARYGRGLWGACDDPALDRAATSVAQSDKVGIRVVGSDVPVSGSASTTNAGSGSSAVRRGAGSADLWPDPDPAQVRSAGAAPAARTIASAPSLETAAPAPPPVAAEPAYVAPAEPVYAPPAEPAYVPPAKPVYVSAPEPAPQPAPSRNCDQS
jgi:micrococcal nuclease